MYYSVTELKNDLNEAMQGLLQEYETATDKSWERYVTTLPQGSTLPARGRFYDQETKAAYNDKVRERAAKANEAVKRFTDGLSKKTSTAPSEEALRAVQMFLLMDPETITATDYQERVNDMLTRYGDSVITYETIRSNANKNGYHDIPPHVDIAAKEAVKTLETSIRRFFNDQTVTASASTGNVTKGSIVFTQMMLNESLAELDRVGVLPE